ncbi:MAG: AAA family ATPase [Subdoligranulum sp.]|nr:AAA family ATPase [Subdoligranulum sp.]
MDTKIIFVGNYKGGVGKTTSVLNFAEYFSRAEKKVLVLDLDPQSSLSEILVKNNSQNGNQATELNKLDEKKTLNYVYDLHISRIKKYNSISLKFDDDIVQEYKNGRFDFIASSLFYKDGVGLDELAVRMEDTVEYLSILKQFLDPLLDRKRYDFVLIDCPPSNNLITRSAFLLSDYYIIPTILDGISTNGVAHYINTVRNTYQHYCETSPDSSLMKHFFGPRPKLIGIFCTFIRKQVDYSSEFSALKSYVEGKCKDNIYIFEEEINNYIDIARSTQVGESSLARKDYQTLSEQVLSRILEMERAD